MNTALFRNKLAGAAAFLLAAFLVAGTALAVNQPPQEVNQQRAWLVGHLVTDMEALGTFDSTALTRVPGIVNSLTDDQVGLLAQYYYLTRSKAEQDGYLYALQQQGRTVEQVNAARAEIADFLMAVNDQIVACYSQLLPMPQPVVYLAQICYASVPGWCCRAGCLVPEWYYANGSFVGPVLNAACSGPWAVPVHRTFYDHGSRFYTTYHKSVAQHRNPTPHANHATAARPAKAEHKAAKPHASHASAPHPLAAHSAAHGGHPKPQAHAPRPQHVAHARPQPRHVTHAHPASGRARSE